MSLRAGVVAALAGQALAFPWVASHVGMDPREMAKRDSLVERQDPGSNVCPFNPNHQGAVPYNPKYPYCGAINGAPGFQVCANNLVPAKGDTAHAWQAPGKNDIRGPCPGLVSTRSPHRCIVARTNSIIEHCCKRECISPGGFDLQY